MNTRAANRYAKALLELASKNKIEDQVQIDMQNIALSIAGSKELKQILSSPVLENSLKKATIDAVFAKNSSTLTQKMFVLLAENKRLDLLSVVASQYALRYNEQKGIIKAFVTSAVALDENLTRKVLDKAKELVGDKQINLESHIQKDLIGGFVLRVGDLQVDTSIATQLKKLKREMIEKN